MSLYESINPNRLRRGPGRVKKNRYRYFDSQPCADADIVFSKRKKNSAYTHKLMVNGARVAIGTHASLSAFAARHRIAGTIVEGADQ